MRENYVHGVLCDGQEARETVSMDWNLALQKMEVRFVADHGGGYPEALEQLSEEQRVTLLNTLGYRVRERWEFDDSVRAGEHDLKQWARLSGGIVVNLTDGWVCREVRT